MVDKGGKSFTCQIPNLWVNVDSEGRRHSCFSCVTQRKRKDSKVQTEVMVENILVFSTLLYEAEADFGIFLP